MKLFLGILMLTSVALAEDKSTTQAKTSAHEEALERKYFFIGVDVFYALRNWTDGIEFGILRTSQSDSLGAYRLSVEVYPIDFLGIGFTYAYRGRSEISKSFIFLGDSDPAPRTTILEKQYGVQVSYQLLRNPQAALWARTRIDYVTLNVTRDYLKDGNFVEAKGASFNPGLLVTPMLVFRRDLFGLAAIECGGGIGVSVLRSSYSFDESSVEEEASSFPLLFTASIGIAL